MGIKVQRIKINLRDNLAKLKNSSVKVGWTQEHNVRHALINEFGAELKGGQPYFMDGNGNLHFLKKDSKLGKKALKSNPSTGAMTKIKRYGVKTDGYKKQAREIIGLGVTKPSRIPARPFMSNTVQNKKAEWKKVISTVLQQVIDGQSELKTALNTIGITVQTDIQATIAEGNFTANSAMTVQRKGRNSPLIDTGEMRDSLTYEVTENE